MIGAGQGLSYISIHTPTKGATSGTRSNAEIAKNFNPHSHEGSDKGYIKLCKDNFISIHTPTKGATVSEGVTIYNLLFQSTLPRRERRSQA